MASLLQHAPFLFDLGVHKDWATLAPDLAAQVEGSGSSMLVPQDVPTSLRGTAPAYVCISHVHIDHIGNPGDPAFARATFLVGASVAPHLRNEGYVTSCVPRCQGARIWYVIPVYMLQGRC